MQPARWNALLTASLLFLSGCGDGGNLVSVSGKVTNDGKVLTTGTVTFYPDKNKGNTSQDIPIGQIGEDGTYTLYTGQRYGAPPGAYKVTVVAEEPRAQGKAEDEYAIPKYLVRQDYLDVEQTPLFLEVKPGAPEGHYDLKLEKKK